MDHGVLAALAACLDYFHVQLANEAALLITGCTILKSSQWLDCRAAAALLISHRLDDLEIISMAGGWTAGRRLFDSPWTHLAR